MLKRLHQILSFMQFYVFNNFTYMIIEPNYEYDTTNFYYESDYLIITFYRIHTWLNYCNKNLLTHLLGDDEISYVNLITFY